MAKYYIEHTCGHEETVELFGKVSERERRIEWLEAHSCTECWKKERKAETKAREAKAIEAIKQKLGENAYNAITGLAKSTNEGELKGSDKQVSWAEDIKDGFVHQAIKELWGIVLRLHTEATDRQKTVVTARINAIAEVVRTEDSAAWWIENRNDIAKAVLREAIKRAPELREM